MSELADSQGPSILDDPEGFMERQREKLSSESTETETPAVESEASQPPPEEPREEPQAASAAAPEPAKQSWRDIVIPEDDPEVDGFFKGKKAGEILKSHKSLVNEFQERNRKLHELEVEVASLKAVKDLLPELTGKKPAQPKNRYEEAGIDLDIDPIANPRKVFEFQEQRQAEQLQSLKQEIKQEAYAEIKQRTYEESVLTALDKARDTLGFEGPQFGPIVTDLMTMVYQKHGESGLTNDKAYLEAFVDAVKDRQVRAEKAAAALGLAPQPVASPPPEPPPALPPAQGNPPGAKRAAGPEPPKSTPTLGYQQRKRLEEQAEALRDSLGDEVAKRFLENATQRLAARG